MDANCSVPAVSNISRTHGELSTYKKQQQQNEETINDHKT